MIMSGLLLGFMAAFALLVLYRKSPLWLRSFIERHPLMGEIISLIFFFTSITSVTSSLVGVIGTFVAGFLWTAYFFVFKSNPPKAT